MRESDSDAAYTTSMTVAELVKACGGDAIDVGRVLAPFLWPDAHGYDSPSDFRQHVVKLLSSDFFGHFRRVDEKRQGCSLPPETDSGESSCAECLRLKAKLEWCRNELYGWAGFLDRRDHRKPFGRKVGHSGSDEEVSYFSVIDQNIGDD